VIFPTASAWAGRLSPDLVEQLAQPGSQPVRVIIETKGRPKQRIQNLVRRRGGRKLRSFRAMNGLAAELPLSVLAALARRKDVSYIVPDRQVGGTMDLSAAATGAVTARANTGLDGAGIGVAVLDTGVAPHPDLVTPTNRITGWVDLVNGRRSPYDDSGHGTHVAGIIAGNGASAAGSRRDLRGIAPRANIIGVKVLDQDTQGQTSTVIAGLDWCLRNRSRYKIRVVNLSLGQPVQETYALDPLCRAVEKLCAAGLVVVVSAGNEGRVDPQRADSGTRYGSISSPGNDPWVITVGASRSNYTPSPADDEMATYSSRGPTLVDHFVKPDLVAPGNHVLSLLSEGQVSAAFPQAVITAGPSRFLDLSGTSMAAPVVSGAVALMLQAAPRLDPDTVKTRLMLSARKRWNLRAPDYDVCSRGAGLLDIPAALASAVRAAGRAFSPTLVRGTDPGTLGLRPTPAGNGSATDPALLSSMAGSSNRQMTIWGDLMIWGDAPPRRAALWGDLMIWGDGPTRVFAPMPDPISTSPPLTSPLPSPGSSP
jgi:serine protease AprX